MRRKPRRDSLDGEHTVIAWRARQPIHLLPSSRDTKTNNAHWNEIRTCTAMTDRVLQTCAPTVQGDSPISGTKQSAHQGALFFKEAKTRILGIKDGPAIRLDLASHSRLQKL